MAKSKQNDSVHAQHLRDAWKVCEKVAMHFNILLQGFRLKAIGGIAIGSAIVVGLKLCDTTNHLAIALFFAALAIVWALIWALDFFYYYPLLAGAVDELLRIERELGDVYLSHQIEHRVAHRYPAAGVTATSDLSNLHAAPAPPSYPPLPIRVFYVVPFLLLIAASLVAGCWCAITQEREEESRPRTCCASAGENEGIIPKTDEFDIPSL